MAFFYDPHPGLKSEMISLPEIILIIARSLDGKEMEVSDVISIVQDAGNVLVANGHFVSALAEDRQDYISLVLTETGGFPLHSFRVIRYKKSSEVQV